MVAVGIWSGDGGGVWKRKHGPVDGFTAQTLAVFSVVLKTQTITIFWVLAACRAEGSLCRQNERISQTAVAAAITETAVEQ